MTTPYWTRPEPPYHVAIFTITPSGTDPEGYAAAIDVGYDMVRYELMNKINESLHVTARLAPASQAIGGAAS